MVTRSISRKARQAQPRRGKVHPEVIEAAVPVEPAASRGPESMPPVAELEGRLRHANTLAWNCWRTVDCAADALDAEAKDVPFEHHEKMLEVLGSLRCAAYVLRDLTHNLYPDSMLDRDGE
jgi:hypothetical protein